MDLALTLAALITALLYAPKARALDSPMLQVSAALGSTLRCHTHAVALLCCKLLVAGCWLLTAKLPLMLSMLMSDLTAALRLQAPQ